MKAEDVQQALYTRLATYAPVATAVTAVYTDDAPQDPESEDDSAFPYITLLEAAQSPDDTKTDNGISALWDVHLWGRPTASISITTLRGIADRAYDALQKYDGLSVPDATVVGCRYSGSAYFKDPDGKTHHFIRTFRITYRFAE